MRAVVLFGHGSRDAKWREPMDAVARRVEDKGVLVRCAFLELQHPDLAAAVAELVEAGASSIRVVPMFLGTGRHAREDLPPLVDALRTLHQGVQIELRAAVGEDSRLLALLAEIAVD